jgi:hypothetical protein
MLLLTQIMEDVWKVGPDEILLILLSDTGDMRDTGSLQLLKLGLPSSRIRSCTYMLVESHGTILAFEYTKYGNMEKLDQSSLRPLIKQPERDMSRPGIKPRALYKKASYINYSGSLQYL